MTFTELDRKVEATSKDFLFFNANQFDEIEKYIITNDYKRHINKYTNAMSIEKAKNININLQVSNKSIIFEYN